MYVLSLTIIHILQLLQKWHAQYTFGIQSSVCSSVTERHFNTLLLMKEYF